ncbi:MAG: helix-hairpin-helix domain-containing protein [Bacteroidales bacterium]|nr:helix-hairpin-helix domain-containing protein [Bacteroidales bacterium]HNW73607.1 helix-hairpin-helix domain-containing protein [Bacteroidales bacterium]HPS50178.1 helix-hairpin-helix domain-containing protein [Bacteroidales bacterium]
MKIVRFVLLFWMIPVFAFCQFDHLGEIVEKAAEQETESGYDDLVEEFVEKASHPVNLNTRKQEDLYEIPFLSPAHVKNLMDYRSTYGELFSIYELRTIPGFDSLMICKIAPFVNVIPDSHLPAFSFRNFFKLGRHDLMMRARQAFPVSKGYQRPDTTAGLNSNLYYPGDPRYYYFRYQFTWFDKISFGFSGEKDPGEEFFKGAQKNGFDFYGGYLMLNNIGVISRLVVGNFRVQFGQGLTIGTGMTAGSMPGSVPSPAGPAGIRPALGINEATGLRGIAVTLRKNHAELSGFVSYTSRGGTVTKIDSISGRAEEISSIYSGGYHRTPSEIGKQDILDELLVGGHLGFSASPGQNWGFSAGLTGTYMHYSAAIKPEQDPYNLFRFSGNVNHNLGFDFRLRIGKLFLFGEVSRSMNGGWAGIAGCTFTPGQNVTVHARYRYYQPAFQNLFSNALGQGSANANEEGIFLSLNAAISSKISLSGYADLFSFPWLKYRVDAPTRGNESGVILDLRVSKISGFEFRYYRKHTRINGVGTNGMHLHPLTDNTVQSFRTVFDLSASERLLLRTRIEFRAVSRPVCSVQQGFLVYQDARLNNIGWLTGVTLRVGIFDTDGYDARFYVFEPGVLYDYSMACLDGKGMRYCLVLKAKPCNQVNFWLQGGVTVYTDRTEIGSGADLTEGNVKAEVTAQLQIKL